MGFCNEKGMIANEANHEHEAESAVRLKCKNDVAAPEIATAR